MTNDLQALFIPIGNQAEFYILINNKRGIDQLVANLASQCGLGQAGADIQRNIVY